MFRLIIETKKVGNTQLCQTNRKSQVIKHISVLKCLLADMEVGRKKESSNEEVIELSKEKIDELLALEAEQDSGQIYKSEKSTVNNLNKILND